MQALKILSVNLLYQGLFLSNLICAPSSVRYFYGICTKVTDGDTVVINDTYKIRMLGIDSPELDQKSLDGVAIGIKSTKFLKKLILNKKVFIHVNGKGYYGRALGSIYLKGKNINRLMIEEGHSVSYGPLYENQEYLARLKKKEIWKTSGFYYPKVYRKNKRKKGFTKKY